MQRFILTLPPELLTRLRSAADRNGISIAHLIRLIVEEWLKGKGY